MNRRCTTRFLKATFAIVTALTTFLIAPDLTSAQNYGIPVWGSPYQTAPTPGATPRPSATPAEAVLPIGVFAVNSNYRQSKELRVQRDQSTVELDYNWQVQFLMRNAPFATISATPMLGNYYFVTRSEGVLNPEVGAKTQVTYAGACPETRSFIAGGCTTNETRSTAQDYDTPAQSTSTSRAWTVSDVASRPYQCAVSQYVDANGARLDIPNTYSEETQLNLFVDGDPARRFVVRFDLFVSTIVPNVSALFRQSNPSSLMTPRASRQVALNQIQIEGFAPVAGSTTSFQGIVHGRIPTRISVYTPASGEERTASGRIASTYNCLSVAITRPRVVQDLGD